MNLDVQVSQNLISTLGGKGSEGGEREEEGGVALIAAEGGWKKSSMILSLLF